MKKNRLLSLFLALVMFFGVVSALGGSAMAAVDVFKAWITDGKLYWDAYEGAQYYEIYYHETTEGWNGDLPKNYSYSDMPVTLKDAFSNFASDTFSIRVWVVNDNSRIAGSNSIIYDHIGTLPRFETPNGYWDGTTIRWDKIDLAPYMQYGIKEDDLYYDVTLYRDSSQVSRKSFRYKNNVYSWDVSDNINSLNKDYRFTIRFKDVNYYKKVDDSKLYESRLVLGEMLVNGYRELGGSVVINNTSPSVGSVLSYSLSGEVSTIPLEKLSFVWQCSDNGSAGWSYLQSGINPYTVKKDDEGKYIRISIHADGYKELLISEPVYVTPALTGTVTVSQTNTADRINLTANLSGAAANIPADKLRYDWRYVVTTDVYGRIRPTGGTYKTLTLPQGDYSTRRYFVYVTADGYEGYLQSSYVRIDAGSSYPKGDVDRSGQVGNSDLIMVARHVVHIITLTGEQFTLGDMDNDKVIDNKDIISVARKVVGL